MSHQALTTKYFGPSNVRGSRIRVKCQAKTKFYDWDHAVGTAENHRNAARALLADLRWSGEWAPGGLPSEDGDVFVCVKRTHNPANPDTGEVRIIHW